MAALTELAMKRVKKSVMSAYNQSQGRRPRSYLQKRQRQLAYLIGG
jgi:hypothetical protein